MATKREGKAKAKMKESVLSSRLSEIDNRFMGSRGMSEEQVALKYMADKVDPKKVGLDSVGNIYLQNKNDNRNYLVAACKRYAIAQALKDNLSFTESGLVIRDILPQFDLIGAPPEGFMSYYGNHYSGLSDSGKSVRLGERCPPEWRQPVWGYYESAGKEVPIYNGRIDDDRKDMIIYGVVNTRPGHQVYAQHMKIMRGNVKTIDVHHIAADINLTTASSHTLPTPVLFKRGDWPVISMVTSTDAIHNYDQFALQGIVVETLGSNMTG